MSANLKLPSSITAAAVKPVAHEHNSDKAALNVSAQSSEKARTAVNSKNLFAAAVHYDIASGAASLAGNYTLAHKFSSAARKAEAEAEACAHPPTAADAAARALTSLNAVKQASARQDAPSLNAYIKVYAADAQAAAKAAVANITDAISRTKADTVIFASKRATTILPVAESASTRYLKIDYHFYASTRHLNRDDLDSTSMRYLNRDDLGSGYPPQRELEAAIDNRIAANNVARNAAALVENDSKIYTDYIEYLMLRTL